VSVRAAAELLKNMQVEIDPFSSQPFADIDQQLIRGIDADEPRPWELQVEDQAQSLGIEKLSRSPVVSSSSRTAGWSQVGSRAVAALEGPGREPEDPSDGAPRCSCACLAPGVPSR